MRKWLAAIAMAGTALGCAGGRWPGQIVSPVPSADTASTDIYLLSLDGKEVSNITNRRGYDNQPSWESKNRILYTSEHDRQTDIYDIDFSFNRINRVTDTPEREYSPALTPDGKAISVVRVEADSAQRLWRFPKTGRPPTVILPEVRPVGYYAWLDTSTVALFVLGNPNSLQIGNTQTGRARVVATNIGRSLQRVPGGRRASYLHRVGTSWVLETVDPEQRSDLRFAIDTITVMPDSADFVVWKSDKELYTAAGSRILRMKLPDKRWVLVVDLASKGIRRISRLAISPDGSRLAFVADDRAPGAP
jgi:dipeptidyl aminopeptidase/acylaminoacyl peptidase